MAPGSSYQGCSEHPLCFLTGPYRKGFLAWKEQSSTIIKSKGDIILPLKCKNSGRATVKSVILAPFLNCQWVVPFGGSPWGQVLASCSAFFLNGVSRSLAVSQLVTELWVRKGWCGVVFKLLSYTWLFETSWTISHQAPLSMEFSRQDCWSGLSFLPPGDLSDPEIEPTSGRQILHHWATREVRKGCGGGGRSEKKEKAEKKTRKQQQNIFVQRKVKKKKKKKPLWSRDLDSSAHSYCAQGWAPPTFPEHTQQFPFLWLLVQRR